MHKLFIKLTISFFAIFLLSLSSAFSQNIKHWEMVVAADDTWNYFPGKSEPPSDWMNINFDPSSWHSGRGGFGYGDSDDETTIETVPSVYIRISFNIVDKSSISKALLHIDYDDAFVAYLNGHEIARANIGTVGVLPSFSTLATSNHEAQIYSGGAAEFFFIADEVLLNFLNQGENVLAIQAHNVSNSSSDLSLIPFLTLGISDDTYYYRSIPDWLHFVPFIDSKLPIFVIETSGESIGNQDKITAHLNVVNNGEGKFNSFFDTGTDYAGNIGIEIRGRSSQLFPKKSYSFETRDDLGEGIDVSLLGMPLEEDWILYAPYSDKTMLRNAITFYLGGKLGNWQPEFAFCELYLNREYKGVYLLMEKIKRDKNRLDLSKLPPEDIIGDELTGGYILKVDKIDDLASNEYFKTYPSIGYHDARDYAFTYVYPDFDVIAAQQKIYINDFLVELQNTLNGNSFQDPVNGYSKYLDINSFIDFQIMNELSNNVDGYRYSTYFYKKKDSEGGKLFAGPLWDFNLGYGNVDYAPINLATDQWLYLNYGPHARNTMHWWARLMEDPAYKQSLYERWTELRASSFSTESILTNLSDMVQYLGDAIDRNFDKWPIIGQYVWPNENWEFNTSYQQELDYMEDWLVDRLNWMDANITSITGFYSAENQTDNISIFPNPVSTQLNIQLALEQINTIEIEIVDLLGKLVFHSDYSPDFVGNNSINMPIPQIDNGYYILLIKQNESLIATQKLIIQN